MTTIRYKIVEVRYSRPPMITATDQESGRTVVFAWPVEPLPTQRELAHIFTGSDASPEPDSLAEVPSPDAGVDRRRSFRMRHAFEGRRQGILPVPLRIWDLSLGGCLIESNNPEAPGRRMRIDIDLPWEGWTTVDAEVVNIRRGYGYGVQFIAVPDSIHRRLERVLNRIGPLQPAAQ